MFYVPQGPDFQWYYSNTLNTSPATNFGTSVVANSGSTTYGAWAEVASAANIAQDVYGVFINFNSGSQSGGIRNILCEMGVDNAGGTSYISVIPSLLAGFANPYTTPPSGINYYFPLYIKAGSSIAFRAHANTAITFRVNAYFYGQPRRPEAVRAGSYVTAFGVDNTTRQGTAITAGTTSEGAWTQLGSATTTSYWWWQTGFSVSTATLSNFSLHTDISAGSAASKKILLENQLWYTNSAEQLGCIPMFQNAYNNVASGQIIYGRAQSSASMTGQGAAMAAYGVGG